MPLYIGGSSILENPADESLRACEMVQCAEALVHRLLTWLQPLDPKNSWRQLTSEISPLIHTHAVAHRSALTQYV